MEIVHNVINLCALFDVGVGATCASNALHKVPILRQLPVTCVCVGSQNAFVWPSSELRTTQNTSTCTLHHTRTHPSAHTPTHAYTPLCIRACAVQQEHPGSGHRTAIERSRCLETGTLLGYEARCLDTRHVDWRRSTLLGDALCRRVYFHLLKAWQMYRIDTWRQGDSGEGSRRGAKALHSYRGDPGSSAGVKWTSC